MVRTLRRFVLVLVVFASVIQPVWSATTVPSSVTSTWKSGAEIFADLITKTTYTSPGSVLQAARYTKLTRVPVTLASVGRMAYGAMGGPLGAALTLAFVAYDLFWDDSSSEWRTVGSGTFETVTWPGCYYNLSYAYSDCEPAATDMQDDYCAYWTSSGHSFYGWSCTVTGEEACSGYSGAWGYDFTKAGQPVVHSVGCYQWSTTKTVVKPESWVDPAPASDQQLSDAMSEDLRRKVMNDSLSSGRWPVEWPELQTNLDKVNDVVSNVYEGDTSTTYDNDTYNSVTNQTGDQPAADASDSGDPPIDCDFFPTLCAFLEWFQGEPALEAAPQVPIVDVAGQDYTSPLDGVGSCPAPRTVSSPFGDFTLSYDAWCAFAVQVRPLVIAAAYIMAAFMLVGGLRRG